MGRGSGNKAVTAHGLLFGPRSRGAGPQDQRVRIPLSEARRGPVLAEACKEAGVIAPEIDSDELFAEKKAYFVVDRSDQGQGSYTIALTRDARWLAGATLSYDDVSFGGAKASLASVKVEGGDKEIAGLRDLEEALCEPLREAGFDYLEFELSGREAVERFDRGEPIDLAAMSWHETNITSRHWAIKKRLEDFRDGELGGFTADLSDYEQEELDAAVDDLLGRIDGNDDGRLLADPLASDVGRAVLTEMPARIPVRIMLSDQGHLSAGVARGSH